MNCIPPLFDGLRKKRALPFKDTADFPECGPAGSVFATEIIRPISGPGPCNGCPVHFEVVDFLGHHLVRIAVDIGLSADCVRCVGRLTVYGTIHSYWLKVDADIRLGDFRLNDLSERREDVVVADVVRERIDLSIAVGIGLPWDGLHPVVAVAPEMLYSKIVVAAQRRPQDFLKTPPAILKLSLFDNFGYCVNELLGQVPEMVSVVLRLLHCNLHRSRASHRSGSPRDSLHESASIDGWGQLFSALAIPSRMRS